MRKIRKEKDFVVKWPIFRRNANGEREPYFIDQQTAQLRVQPPIGEAFKADEVSIEGNMVTWIFRGKSQIYSGIYGLILVENDGADGMVTVDTCKAFELVDHSCQETPAVGGDVVIDAVVLEGEVAFAPVVIELGGEPYDDTELREAIADLQEKTDTKLTELSAEINGFFPLSINLYTGETITGYVNSSTGALTSYASAKSSLPIPIQGGKVYSLTGRNGDSTSIRCLDAEGKPLKVLAAETREESQYFQLRTIDGKDAALNGQFATPSNAVSVQFTIQLSNEASNEIMLEYVGEEYSPDFVPTAFNGFGGRKLAEEYIPKAILEDIAKIAPIEESITDIKNSLSVKQEKDIQGVKNYAYTLAVGAAPVGAARTDYIAFVVEKLEKGDIIIPKTQTGSSLSSYAKVKDGIIIEVGAKGAALNSPIECDGTYDAFYINNYAGYVAAPYCQLEKKIPISEVLKVSKKSFKILCFGNSFTQDSMSYAPFILKNVAPELDVTIGIAYIGGCTLAQHCANLTGESVTSDGTTYSPTPYILYLYKNEADSWSNKASHTADALLALEEWDIITFQQAGSYAWQSWETYYAPFIYKIHKAIYDKVSHSVKFGWLSIHGAYANDVDGIKTMWEQTTENTEKVQNLTGNEVIFPFGTAVQNLSTITSLADIGEGAGMTADGGHLHEGLPCLAAAYANALILLREAGIEGKSIIGEGTRPTKEWCNKIGVPGTNYGTTINDVVGVTDDNAYYAQVAAIQALKKPYELTDISMIM